MRRYPGMRLPPGVDPLLRSELVKADRQLKQISSALAKSLTKSNLPQPIIGVGGGNQGSSLPDHDHRGGGFGGSTLGRSGFTMAVAGTWGATSNTVFRGNVDPAFGTINHNYIDNRTRSIWIPPTNWIQANGTASATATFGTYPDEVLGWDWIDAPAAGPVGHGTGIIIPQDYVSGTDITPYLYFTKPPPALADAEFVIRLHYLSVAAVQNVRGAATTISTTITDRTLTGSGGDINVETDLGIKTLSSNIPAATLASGEYLRLTIDRLTTDAADNSIHAYTFLGLRLDYTADM